MSWISLLLYTLAAVTVGALMPLQAGTNAKLSRVLGHPLLGALGSLAVSTIIAIALLLILRVQFPSFGLMSRAPWWAWLGGFFGVAFVTTALFVAPRMGSAPFMVAVVAGQVAAALIIDHYALVGFPERPINLWRLVGAGLVIGGLLVMQLAPSGAKAAQKSVQMPSEPPVNR